MSSQDLPPSIPAEPAPEAPKRLTPAARRALDEAAERRTKAQAEAMAAEEGGPPGPEPTRFGDWERRGIAVDF